MNKEGPPLIFRGQTNLTLHHFQDELTKLQERINALESKNDLLEVRINNLELKKWLIIYDIILEELFV